MPSFSPAVVVSTGVFQAKVVFAGKSFTLAIPALASGVPPTSTVTFCPCGSFFSASVRLSVTTTLTGTSSVVLSGYVTTTVASFVPSVAVSTGSLNATVVPAGKSFKLAIESSAFGASFKPTSCSLPCGSYFSASVRLSVTTTLTGTSSLDPSG